MKLSGSDIHLLTVFDTVVRSGGFSAAQVELGLSQPTISNHISALEERLGVKLCQRGRRGFLLTEKGKIVHEIGKTLLNSIDTHSSKLAELKGNLVGPLKVAVVDCVASDEKFRLPQAISDLVSKAPAVRLDLGIHRPQEILSGLMDGSFHAGLGSFDNRVNGIEFTDLYVETHGLFCARTHELFDTPDGELTREIIDARPWVHRGYWSKQRQKLQNQADFDRVVYEIEAQVLAVLSGCYLGILPEHTAAPYVASGRLRQLPLFGMDYDVPMQLVARSGPKPKIIQLFCETIRQQYQV